MKNWILFTAFLMGAWQMNAQVANDSVAIGAGYANTVWYSLENGEVASAPKNNWDIAFETTAGFGWAVHINAESNVNLWSYSTDTTEWGTIDTTGLSTLPKLYNSDTTWFIGAFDYNQDLTNNDLGWGMYTPSHAVIGYRIYIIQLSDASFRKIWIQKLASGEYTFRYANIDGSNDVVETIAKADYATKNLIYYSIVNDSVVDREPAKEEWDLVFGQYYARVQDSGGNIVPSAATGVRSNSTVTVAKAEDVNDTTYYDYAAETFETNITTIGHYWKGIDYVTFQWYIVDSLVYFVGTEEGDIWRVKFTNFVGSGAGKYVFSKEQLVEGDTVGTGPNGIFETNDLAATMVVYPNPSNGQDVSVVYNILNQADAATLSVHDLTGREVYAANVGTATGVQQHRLPAQELNAGMYIVTLTVNGQQTQQKLIVR